MKNLSPTDPDTIPLDDDTGLIVEEDKPEQGLELHVGSNVFRGTSGVVTLQGKEQIVFEIQPDPPALRLTMDFYDEKGQRVGHLRRNTFPAGGATCFAVSTAATADATIDDPITVKVSDRTTGAMIIEAYLFQRRKIRVMHGNFYTHKGDLVSISPHYCRIGTGLTMFGNVIESRGGAAIIG